MSPYESILLPFDGSEDAAEVLHHAAEIAHWADATLDVLFVADTTRDSVTVVGDEVVDGLVERGASVVEEAAKTLETLGVDYDIDVVQGTPSPTIVEYAERYDHDLIVMATHGREGLSRYLNRSVAEAVIGRSSIPVLTARMQPDEEFSFPYETVLIPTDGSAAAIRAADHGLALAEALGATVHVLSVVEGDSLNVDASGGETVEDEAAADAAVDEIVSKAEARDIPTPVTHTERGAAEEAILDYVESNDVHVVVMGATGRRGAEDRLFGTTAQRAARTVPVPVLTVGTPQ